MNKKTRANALLLLAALIWGLAFVAQSVSLDYVGSFTFNGARSLLGSLVLVPVFLLLDRRRASRGESGAYDGSPAAKRTLITGGVLCGIVLFIATNLQQFGLNYTSVGKAGFITALYIVLVPVLGIFIGKRTRLITWLSVVIAVVGFYFLSIKEDFSIGFGDVLMLLCAFVFSVHILVIDRFSPLTDGVRMSCIQFLVSGVLSTVCALIFENPSLDGIIGAAIPILYAGILSSGVAYTLQIVGQKDTNPTVASLLLSLESVFAALSGWIILSESLSPRELGGCALVFCAVIAAQLPERKRKQKSHRTLT